MNNNRLSLQAILGLVLTTLGSVMLFSALAKLPIWLGMFQAVGTKGPGNLMWLSLWLSLMPILAALAVLVSGITIFLRGRAKPAGRSTEVPPGPVTSYDKFIGGLMVAANAIALVTTGGCCAVMTYSIFRSGFGTGIEIMLLFWAIPVAAFVGIRRGLRRMGWQ